MAKRMRSNTDRGSEQQVVRRRRWTRSPERKLRRHLSQKERRTQRQEETADQRLRELEPKRKKKKRLAQSLRRNQRLKTRRASQLANLWQSQKRSRLLQHLWRSVCRRSAKLDLKTKNRHRVKTRSQQALENKQLPSPAQKESASALSRRRTQKLN